MLFRLLILLLFISGHVLSNAMDVMHVKYQHFGTVYDVLELKNENKIIIASEKGVFYFTGKVFSKIKSKENEVFHKFYLNNGQIHVLSFSDNVYKVVNDSLQLVASAKMKQQINSFVVNNNKIYISTLKNVYVSDGQKVSKLQINKGYIHHGFLIDNRNVYLVSQQNNLLRFNDILGSNAFTLEFNNRISGVFFNQSNNYLIANNKLYGLDVENQLVISLFDLPARLRNIKIYGVSKLDDNHMVIAHNNGISIIDLVNKHWKHHLEHITVYSVIGDEYGNIWLGTKFSGLLQVPSLKILHHHINIKNNPKDNITAAYLHQGKLFLGTNHGRIQIYDLKNDSTQVINLSNNAEVQSIYVRKNKIYAYCDRLYKINTDNNTIEEVYKVHSTKAIYVDEKDNIYCATSGDFQNIKKQTKVNNGYWHTCIYADTTLQSYFVGTKSGYAVFKQNALQKLKNIETENKKRIINIGKIKGKHLFYSTNGIVYDNRLQPMYRHKNINNVQGVAFYQDSTYLLYNNNKIVWVTNRNEKNIEIINKINNGAQIVKILPYKNDVIILTQDEIVVVKDFANLYQKNFEQSLALNITSNSFTGNNNDINLKYKNSGIQLFFNTNKDLSFFTNYIIRYQIDDDDTLTIAANSKGKYVLKLNFLPEGYTNITFLLSNKERRIIDQNKVTVYVAGPYWKSWWFMLLVFSAVTGTIYWYQKKKLERIRKENIKQIKQEKMKTRLARSELSVIRSQMNPHFVYNTLSSIQLKIAKKQTDEAFKMVQKFSTLMRGVLSHSQVEMISLKQELDILKNYIELEQARFEDSVKVTYTIDKQMDLSDYLIPSLITQPIVENSLQHGLRHKTGEKKLEIKIYKLNEITFCIEIEDNGIGIDAANAINKENRQKKSFAIMALKRRINFINSLGDYFIELTVNSNAHGTKTIIRIAEK